MSFFRKGKVLDCDRTQGKQQTKKGEDDANHTKRGRKKTDGTGDLESSSNDGRGKKRSYCVHLVTIKDKKAETWPVRDAREKKKRSVPAVTRRRDPPLVTGAQSEKKVGKGKKHSTGIGRREKGGGGSVSSQREKERTGVR